MTVLTKNTLPSQPSLIIIKAKGSVLWDKNGKSYIDFSSQTLNLSFGQCHARLTRAVVLQLRQFTFLSSRFVSEPLEKLANELVALAPEGMTKINLKLADGSDANESAFKRVRKYHKKQTIASFIWSHHGETAETINASGKHFDNRYYIGGSGKFVFFNPPHPKFFPSSRTIRDAEAASLMQLKHLFDTNIDICAVIVEPVMVNAGVYILSPEYVKNLRQMCNQHNISLIFDEIQTAFGWLGTIFAADKLGVTPDIMTLGKSLSPGFPLAGILMKPQYDILDYGEDEFTYGGHPISCAAARENLKLLKSMNLAKMIHRKENILRKLLLQLQKKFSFIQNIRGNGLIWAIDFNPLTTLGSPSAIYQKALYNGLILRKSCDGEGSSLILKPPIITSEKLLRLGIKRLYKTLKS